MYVKIGMKGIFRSSSLHKVREITTIRPLTAEETENERASKLAAAEAAAAEAAAPTKGKKAATSSENKVDSAMGFISPNADKYVPSCISIRTSPLDTISDLVDFFRYSNS